jgi:hypothetical protein
LHQHQYSSTCSGTAELVPAAAPDDYTHENMNTYGTWY